MRCRIMIRPLATMVSLLFLAAEVQAQQSSKGTSDSPLVQPTQAALPLPNAGASQGYLFNLRPFGEDIGKSLAARGIYLTGRTIDEGFGNVSGGLKRGGLYEGYTSFGVDLDMNTIAGIKGGAFHVLISDLSGQNFAGYSGSQYAFNRVWAYAAAARLNEFSYEQSLFDGRLDLRVGRIPVGTEFDNSPVYCEFVNGLCAIPTAFLYDKGYPAYLTASSAGVARVNLSHQFYFNAGIYEDEPLLATQHHNNWPGSDWGFDKARGVTVPMQIGYRSTFKTDPYPRAFSIGGFIDTGDYSDSLLNSTGRNRLQYGGTAKLDHGKSGLWLQAEQMIWRPDVTSERGLTIFGGANFTTSGNPNVDNVFFAGASMKGLFSSRPNDTFNVMGQYIQLSSAYTTALTTNYQLRGIAKTASASEPFFEVNYGFAVAPGVTFKPFLQYIFNPDQAGVARPVSTNTHSLFIGAAISASFPDALGLPRLQL